MGVIDRRIGILFIVFIALLGIALARATYLGSVRAGSLEREAATQQVSNVVTPAPRGAITDNNGAELALSESADDVVADPYLIKNAVSASAELSSLLGTPQLTELKLLTKAHTGFVYLAHLLPASQAQAIANLHIAGINLVPETRRVYPRGDEAAQVVGSVHQSGAGADGIELKYNNVLQGTSGLRRIVSDARGQPISIDDIKATVPGKTVALTIDSGLQQEVERVLTEVGAEYSPKGATAIVVDPTTGAILALANWRSPSSSPADVPEDQAIGFNYEPGSTFKAITVAGALQDGVVSPNTEFDIPPVLQFADRQIHDAEDHGYETLTVAQILKYSSNIGADLIGQKLGSKPFDSWVHPVRVRPAHGRRPPGRAERHRSALVAVLGLLDGQPTVRAGRVGDTDADGRGVLGDRQRRHPACAARRAVGRRQADGGAGGASDHLPDNGIGAPRHAPRRARRRRDGVRGGDPGLRHGGQDRHREHRDRRPLLGQRLRRLVHRNGSDRPSPAGGGGRGRPAERVDLRRLGGGAGVPADRRLGRAVPRASPALAASAAARSGPRRRAGPAAPRAARPTPRPPRSSSRPRQTAARG